MPIVTFTPGDFTTEVEEGTSLYEAALQAGRPIASSCAGQWTCGKCNVRVVEGEENVSPRVAMEDRLLKKERRPPTDRISCLAKVLGPCKITTSYW